MTFQEFMYLERHDHILGPPEPHIDYPSLWRVTGRMHKDTTNGEWVINLVLDRNNKHTGQLSEATLHQFHLTPYLKRKYGFSDDTNDPA